MAFLFIIYVPILLVLLYFMVGISIDAIDWLIEAIRQRRMTRLLASCKKLWWGRPASVDTPSEVPTLVAANTVINEPAEQAKASNRLVAEPCREAWNGEERRGKPKTLRSFRDFVEMDRALDVVLQAELEEARYKQANSDVWHAIGLVQMRAIDDVRSLIAAIPREAGHVLWQRLLYEELVILSNRYKQEQPVEDDLYWRIDDDQLSYYGPTVWEFVRAITEN